jgi:hypothetical protein
LRLLRIITKLRKLPTTAPPSRSKMTGMRMAQTRGGKSDWTGCESSTKGYVTEGSAGCLSTRK